MPSRLDPAAIKAYYSRWWENPADIRHVVFDRLYEVLGARLRALHLPPGASAVDLGAGRGRVTAMLRERGYATTAVDFSEEFADRLRERFPGTPVECADLARWSPSRNYDLATCINVAQNMEHRDFGALLARLRPRVGRLLVSISNENSLHGLYVRLRGFQAPFVVGYTPGDLHRMLGEAGFEAVSEVGVGFITPLSLFRGFRGVFITPRMAEELKFLDGRFPRRCQEHLVEAVPTSSERQD
ncbi:MAG: class I SAM-dependent methyltransferase [Halobacteria archaeon]